MERAAALTNLTTKVPDHLVRSLEGIAVAQHKTLEHLAIEQLHSLVKAVGGQVYDRHHLTGTTALT